MTSRHGTPASVAAPDADLARLLETEERLAALLSAADMAGSALVTAARREAEAMEAAATAALARELEVREAVLRTAGSATLVALRASSAEQRARLARIDPEALARRVIASLLEPGSDPS